MDEKAGKFKSYFRFVNGLEKIIEWLSAITFSGILVSTLLQVLFRYIFNSPLLWSEELARYLGIFAVLIASSISLKRNQQIGIDFFVDKLPAAAKRPLKVFYALAIIAVMGYLTYYTLMMMRQTFNTPTPAMRIPIGIPYLGMFVGCLTSLTLGICILIETIFKIEVPSAEEVECGKGGMMS